MSRALIIEMKMNGNFSFVSCLFLVFFCGPSIIPTSSTCAAYVGSRDYSMDKLNELSGGMQVHSGRIELSRWALAGNFASTHADDGKFNSDESFYSFPLH